MSATRTLLLALTLASTGCASLWGFDDLTLGDGGASRGDGAGSSSGGTCCFTDAAVLVESQTVLGAMCVCPQAGDSGTCTVQVQGGSACSFDCPSNGPIGADIAGGGSIASSCPATDGGANE